MRIKSIISITAGCALSAGTLYLAFRDVPFNALVIYLGRINYWWLIPSSLIVVGAFILRAYRWRIILMDCRAISFSQAFHPLMVGFMINCVLPLRLGEIARPAILRKKQGIPIATGIASVAAERVLDIMALIVLFLIVFTNIGEQPHLEVTFGTQTLNSQTLQSVLWTLVRLSLVLLAGIMVLSIKTTRITVINLLRVLTYYLGKLCKPRIRKLLYRLLAFSIDTIEKVRMGLRLAHHPKRLMAGILITMAIWGLSVLSYYVFAMGCPGITLSIREMTTVMVIVCFFIALPSAPGFWGLWEAGGVFALTLFGVPNQEAAGFTLMNHAVQMFPVILIGLISAIVTSVNIFHLNLGESAVPSKA